VQSLSRRGETVRKTVSLSNWEEEIFGKPVLETTILKSRLVPSIKDHPVSATEQIRFSVEVIDVDVERREVGVRLRVFFPGDKENDVDRHFNVGPYDFPMLDNTQLPDGLRATTRLPPAWPIVSRRCTWWCSRRQAPASKNGKTSTKSCSICSAPSEARAKRQESIMTSSIQRKAVTALLIGVLLYPAIGAGNNQDASEEGVVGAASDSCDTSVLTISVVGNDKPVTQADVIVMYSPTGEAPVGCSEGKMPPTNDAGQITFTSGGKGRVRIIVIASDWDTCHDYVNLKKGRQTHQINLKRTHTPGHE
jgi:hypothetical protein